MTAIFIRSIIGTAFLLLIPLYGTLTNPNATIKGGAGGGFDWTLFDFTIMGVLLFIAGTTIGFAALKISHPTSRRMAVSGIIVGFLVIWAELAVRPLSQAVALVF